MKIYIIFRICAWGYQEISGVYANRTDAEMDKNSFIEDFPMDEYRITEKIMIV